LCWNCKYFGGKGQVQGKREKGEGKSAEYAKNAGQGNVIKVIPLNKSTMKGWQDTFNESSG